MKTYVTFGSNHIHKVNGKVFDGNCVAVIECENAEEGRKKAFEYFGPEFCFEYPEGHWNADKDMKYYPRGYVEV
jgi:hypothetical protein